MPRLPDYTQLGQPPSARPAGGVASYQPADPTTFSRGMTADAGDLEQASAILAETNQRQDAMVAQDAVNRLKARSLELELGDNGFKRASGGAAVGQQFVDTYSKKYSDESEAIKQSLQNDNQRRVFQQHEPIAQLQYRSALLQHQASETEKFNNQTENDTIDLARRQIFTTSEDPQALSAGLAQINWAIDKKAQRLGWSAPVAEETKRKFTEKVMEDVASMQVERDPVNALAAINKRMGMGQEQGASGVTAIDAIDVTKLVELRHRAASYVAQAENKLKADAEKRLKEAETATKELQTFALSGQMVTRLRARGAHAGGWNALRGASAPDDHLQLHRRHARLLAAAGPAAAPARDWTPSWWVRAAARRTRSSFWPRARSPSTSSRPTRKTPGPRPRASAGRSMCRRRRSPRPTRCPSWLPSACRS
jgi:hypothetical protein